MDVLRRCFTRLYDYLLLLLCTAFKGGVTALAELATIFHCDADLSTGASRKVWAASRAVWDGFDCTFYKGFVLRDDHYIDSGAAISNTNPTSTRQRRPRLSVMSPKNSSMLTRRRRSPKTPNPGRIHHLSQPLMA